MFGKKKGPENEEQKKEHLKQWKIASFTGAVSLVFSLQSIQSGWIQFLMEFAGTWVLLFFVLFLIDEGFDHLSEKKHRVWLFIGIMAATLVLFHSLMDKPIRYGEEADQKQLELVEWAFEYGYETGWDGYGSSATEAYHDMIGDVEDPEEFYIIKEEQERAAKEAKEQAEKEAREAEKAAADAERAAKVAESNFVASTGLMYYHDITCPGISAIPENQIIYWSGTEQELVEQGYRAHDCIGKTDAPEIVVEDGEPMDHYTGEGDYTSRGTPINHDFDMNNVDFQDVDSSVFSKVGYMEDEEILVVVFHSTGPYLYKDVPYSVWEEFLNADSVGTYYNDHIKGTYDCEKIG